jgi:uncharacterized FAD-dependent dehydrogenase
MQPGKAPAGRAERVVRSRAATGGGSAVHRGKGDTRRGKAAPPPPPPPHKGDNAPCSWRLFDTVVPLDADEGKDSCALTPAVLGAAAKRLGVAKLDAAHVRLVRKSLDARQRRTRAHSQPAFSYVLDVSAEALTRRPALAEQTGVLERVPPPPPPGVAASTVFVGAAASAAARLRESEHVVVVGGGPSGLFAALRLAESGVKVTLLERGRPVEERGRAIGSLFVRGNLDGESNLCYGEGGAGTWSDGKLTTRIGRNSDAVRSVLHSLVDFGAPEAILTDGKPHLGTDRLVRILRALRARLLALGASISWGCRVERLVMAAPNSAPASTRRRVTGVQLADGQTVACTAVVLAVGHSARELYGALLDQGVPLEAQGCAVGFRVEHPQAMVDVAQYGEALAEAHVRRGAGKLPVADYRLVSKPGGGDTRQAYSFCMCPGGQIVPTSTSVAELCVNGMSFSKRASPFANSGLVVPVTTQDYAPFAVPGREALAGVAFQRAMEAAAAVAGGGNLVCPVQTVDAFLAGERPQPGAICPQSSYRLGVRLAPEGLHTLYPPQVSRALSSALVGFDRTIPGYASHAGVLHGVETRTSAPVRIVRGDDFESAGVEGLFPVGEGAGYAGGIVSAAVDGIHAADALMAKVMGVEHTEQ